jgi:flagellar biosynthesis/type III secretory pathway protein FliH
MTGTRGLLLALTLVVAAPAAAAQSPNYTRDEAQRNDPRIQRDRRNPGDDRDYRGGWGRAVPRFDVAFRNGEEDGYKEGLRDGERGDRFDPVREKRYRSGDHGYDRRYGPKELYKDRYRDGFRRGYEDGYQDGRRYGRRNSNRGPSWWPFGR